ncbi:zinc finger CCCH domain-containing protein 3 isoform X3 [Elaeis guineensis]|uniref:Zinc finger CCCH domain-containing protein 3 isoform X2 n=1 Tax=Elaeis guineensis var. tenera TaxID=51953 RepID=A0A6I9S6X2_ELAGV|nr:zinc finger CCCH domain-containing protein 3 isoform X2 [Elaeis guineensis]
MPLGKYYCDYCDKQFQDTPSARKRHLQGIQHQRARALWYDSLKVLVRSVDLTSFLSISGATWWRASSSTRWELGERSLPSFRSHGLNFVETVQSPNFLGNQILSGGMVLDHTGVSWGNIPPSLRPPPEGGYPPLPLVDWG